MRPAVVVSAILVLAALVFSPAARAEEGKPEPESDGPVKHLRTVQAHAKYSWCVAFSPDGKTVASGGGDSAVRLTEVGTGNEVWTARGRWQHVYNLAFSPDGKLLATGGAYDHTVRLWDTSTGREVWSGGVGAGGADCVCFSPDGKWLAAGFAQGKIALLALGDPGSTSFVREWKGHKEDVRALAFSPDGKILASGSWDDTVKIWDPSEGKETRVFSEHGASVNALSFSPDGKMLASGGNDQSCIVRRLEDGSVLHKLGHAGMVANVEAVAFFPDGLSLATGDGNGTVRIWDVQSGKQALIFRVAQGGYVGPARIAVSPDGETIAVGQSSGEVSFWQVKASARAKGPSLDDAIRMLKKDRGDESAAQALELLAAAGQEGIDRIRAELDALEKLGEKNDFFRIGAALALLGIGMKGANAPAGALAQMKERVLPLITLALKDVDSASNPQPAFQICATLACLRDPSVLPILRLALRGKDQAAGLPVHSLPLNRRQLLDFVYGAYGRPACEDLKLVLEGSRDPAESASCIYLLGLFRWKPALELVREKARSLVGAAGSSDRGLLLAGIGMMGDTRDVPLLVQSLGEAKDEEAQVHALFGILEMRRVEALADVVPFLSSASRQVESEAFLCLVTFLARSADAFPRAVRLLKEDRGAKGRKELADMLADVLKKFDSTLDKALLMSDVELEGISRRILELVATFEKVPEGNNLLRVELQEVLADWEKNRRPKSEKHGWVKPAHLLRVAGPEDLDALFKVRASFCERLSDECLYDIAPLDEVIRELHRRDMDTSRKDGK